MNWLNLIANFIAILAGLFIYIGIMNTPWGKKHQDIQYGIMLAAVLGACLIGGLIKWLV